MKNILLFFAVAGISLGVAAQKTKNKDRLELKEIWASPAFYAKSVQGIQMLPDGAHYVQQEHDGENRATLVIKYSFRQPVPVDTLFNSLTVKGLPTGFDLEGFKVSSNGNYLLLQTNTKQLYRHSAEAEYYIFNIKDDRVRPVADSKSVFFAEISPDEEKVAYVLANNLYVQDLKTNATRQITTEGKLNHIIYGRTDWVYEEEFALVQGYQWSPQGDKVAYLRFDESKVKEYQLTLYDSLYPTQYRYKYPKAGEANSKVSLYVFDLKKTVNYFIDGTMPGEEEYLPRFKWQNNEVITYHILNRLQNNLRIFASNLQSAAMQDGKPKGSEAVNKASNRYPIYTEKSSTYVDVTDNLIFLKDGSFILTSERGGFNNIYHIKGDKAVALQTNADVVDLYGADERSGLIFYSSYLPGSPLSIYLYKVNINLDPVTIAPLLPKQDGRNSASFSAGYNFFIHKASSAGQPPATSIYYAPGELARVLENNSTLKENLVKLELSKKEFLQIPVNGVTLNTWMIKPRDFSPKKKYPVLFTIYGGPGSQTVKDEWGGNLDIWYQHLADKGYIVMSVDNRGTGGRGADFKKMTYKKLGQVESDDQIAAARYVARLPYVDEKRIGIYGWSFGGYLSALCLMKGADVYKMAVSVAPVTDWRYYDNIYTERFMQTPAMNKEGYDATSVLSYADKLQGRLLLVHGTFDDNVHPQNSLMLMKKLIQLNKPFDSEFYPDKNHGIYGGNTRLHLYSRITTYIMENL